MNERQPIIEVVRVLFHLNGYTKVMVESTEGVWYGRSRHRLGYRNAPYSTSIPGIGSRFVVKVPFATASEDETEIEEIQ